MFHGIIFNKRRRFLLSGRGMNAGRDRHTRQPNPAEPHSSPGSEMLFNIYFLN
jgi:hypothetical protein